jgi:membrane associated rhomboid family serine protease
MIIPIGDDNTDRRTRPVLNLVFIAINVLVWIFPQGMGRGLDFTYAFSTVPQEIVSGQDVVSQDRIVTDPLTGQRYRTLGLRRTPIPVYLTLITAMFMHGSWMHLLGNMLYLWIFGDNLEDVMGRRRYLLFYVVCGVLAGLAHVFASVAIDSGMLTPSLGASGAISGVLGGYIVLFPRRRVRVIMFRILMTVPATVAIGIWFLFQLISGLGYLGGAATGVAYGAHIGGFVAGFLLVRLFASGGQPRGYRRYR